MLRRFERVNGTCPRTPTHTWPTIRHGTKLACGVDCAVDIPIKEFRDEDVHDLPLLKLFSVSKPALTPNMFARFPAAVLIIIQTMCVKGNLAKEKLFNRVLLLWQK